MKKSQKIGAGIVGAIFATAVVLNAIPQSTKIAPVLHFQAATATQQAGRLLLLPPGQPDCKYLDAQTIDLHVIACPGDQPLIDAGGVAILEYVGDALYFAGHRSTHGSVFGGVPSLQIGDIISVRDDHIVQYKVVEVITILVAEVYNHLAAGDWGPYKPLALQTSHPLGTAYRYLVVAVSLQ